MRTWFSYEAVPGTVKVVLANASEFDNLNTEEAASFPERMLIVVLDTLPYDRACRVIYHEMMHMDLSNPGEDNVLCLSLHCTQSEVAAREEDIVSHIAPRSADTLIRNNFLRLPKFRK